MFFQNMVDSVLHISKPRFDHHLPLLWDQRKIQTTDLVASFVLLSAKISPATVIHKVETNIHWASNLRHPHMLTRSPSKWISPVTSPVYHFATESPVGKWHNCAWKSCSCIMRTMRYRWWLRSYIAWDMYIYIYTNIYIYNHIYIRIHVRKTLWPWITRNIHG